MRAATLRGIAAVLVAGGAIGTAVAVADRGTAPTVRAAATALPAAPQRGAPVTPFGPVRVVAQSKDPAGGAPWAVRRFVVHDHRLNGKTDVYSCLQMGRLQGSLFGWISPGSDFRPARFDLADVPSSCGSTFRGGLPQLLTATLTTDAARGNPQPATTVVWGALPPDSVSARLQDGTLLKAGPHGAVLAVLPGRPVGEPTMRGTLRTRSGAQRPFAGPAPPRPRGRPYPAPIGLHVAVRTPDPAGGAAWGIVAAHDAHGDTCITHPGRLVGDRLADVDPRLGVARPDFFAAPVCPTRLTPTRAHPIRADVADFAVQDEDPTGSVQLRRLKGRTAIYARTTPDVRTVTITTSRDIRTLIPDPQTHLVLAVYDGSLPGERAKLTAHLASGRTATVVQSTGG
jgi:hypothetical protein